jgi:uncharacterized membrane protein YfcA
MEWIGAFVIGVSLGLLGAGGSILTVPVLVYLVGQPDKIAIAGSLGIVGGISLIGSLPYAFRGLVDWRNVFFFGIPGMVGTYLGAYIASFLTGAVQLIMFALVMAVAAHKMLHRQKLSDEPHKPKAFWKIGLDGIFVGVITGLVGVGGGFLIIPALVLLGGLPMHLAVGTSLMIIAMKSFSGFYKYMVDLQANHLSLDWTVIGLFTAVGIVGSFVGGYASTRIPQAKLRRAFGYFLIVMAVYVLATTLPKVL